VVSLFQRENELKGDLDEMCQSAEESLHPMVEKLWTRLNSETPTRDQPLRVVSLLASLVFHFLDQPEASEESVKELKSAFSHAMRALSDSVKYGDPEGLAEALVAAIDRKVVRWDAHRERFLKQRKSAIRPVLPRPVEFPRPVESAPSRVYRPPPARTQNRWGQCAYCGKDGHAREECHRRMRDNGVLPPRQQAPFRQPGPPARGGFPFHGNPPGPQPKRR
jgi:hypothetical protein